MPSDSNNILTFPTELTALKQHFAKALDALAPHDQVLVVRGLTSGMLQDEVVLERLIEATAIIAANATIEQLQAV